MESITQVTFGLYNPDGDFVYEVALTQELKMIRQMKLPPIATIDGDYTIEVSGPGYTIQ